MKQLCIRQCQIKLKDQITLIEKGQVIELNTNHKCFQALGDGVDFGVAEKEELLAIKWKFSDAAAFVKETYGVKLVKNEGDSKDKIVDRILDARFRAVNSSSFDNVPVK